MSNPCDSKIQKLLPIEDATDLIRRQLHPTSGSERLPLSIALGRTLKDPIFARYS